MGVHESNTMQSIDELTEIMQNKMTEITEMNNAMSSALQQGTYFYDSLCVKNTKKGRFIVLSIILLLLLR